MTNTLAPDTNNPANNPLFCFVSDGVLGPALHYSTAAIQLAGATSIGTNDYFVSLGVRPDLQFGSNDFTVSYWVRLPFGYQGGDLPFFTDVPQSTGGNGFVFAPAYAYGTAQPNPVAAGQPDPTQWAGSWATSILGGGAGVR